MDNERWYCKWEASGKIYGPMTKDKALELTDVGDGMIFNEQILSPKFVTSSEVEDTITALRVLGKWTQEDRDFNKLSAEVLLVSQRAIDTITLLSHEKEEVAVPPPAEILEMLGELKGLREALEIIRYGEDDLIGRNLTKVMDALIEFSREKIIECSLEGGVFDIESSMPPNVTIVVRDYDVEGAEGVEIVEDSQGRECFVSEYEDKGIIR